MKKYLISFSVLFVVVSLVLVVFYNNLGLVVERAIETYGSRILGTEVLVKAVGVKPRVGVASITGLTIANPTGYSEANAFQFSKMTAKVDFQAEIVRQLLISQPVVNIEVVGGSSNIEQIARNIKAYQAELDNQSPVSGNRDPVILNIELIRIESARAVMVTDFSDKTYQFKIDELVLRDLHGTREQVASQISSRFLKHVAQEVAIEILKEKARTKGVELGNKLKDLIDG